MTSRIWSVCLWLWIINLGIVLGAGLYESRIVVPEWLSQLPNGDWHWDAESARRSNTGLRFWAFVSTGPLTLLTIANVVAAFRAQPPLSRIWLLAAGLAVLERLFTFAYFIPTMIELMSGELSQADAVLSARRWATLNHVRHLLVIAAWLPALWVRTRLPQR